MQVLLFLVFMCVQPLNAQECDDVPVLNQQIVRLADKKIKRKVGRGECWNLAQYVLNETGATWDGFEVYGRLINRDEECVYPGDIIQFENIKLEWEDDDFTYSESMKHHTAIVYDVISKNEIILIHQNTGEHGRRVGTSSMRFDAIRKGKLFIYRPEK